MTPVAATIPTEHDLLCEGCGYTLNGLPDGSNCPECGKPVAESVGSQRVRPAWERETAGRARAFLATSAAVLFRPSHFYRTLATRRDARAARSFGRAHWLIASALMAAAGAIHGLWFLELGGWRVPNRWLFWPVLTVCTFCVVSGLTALAARLTHWEASYRGIRLPLDVVRRGMYYHAAHYVPVGLLAAATVVGYQWLLSRGVVGVGSYTTYLYVLSGEVILSAVYLFNTYWIGMRNMMYANR